MYVESENYIHQKDFTNIHEGKRKMLKKIPCEYLANVKIQCSFLYKDLYFVSNYFKNLHESLAVNSLVASMTWENHVSSYYKTKVIIK